MIHHKKSAYFPTPPSLIHSILNALHLLHHKFASNPINPPQGPVTHTERLLSQTHWNTSFYIVNTSPSFQSSLRLSFQHTPPWITFSSHSSTSDPDQHSHHCIGKQPDTTRNYPTLPLKLDPNFIVPPSAFFWDHNNCEQCIIEQRIESLNNIRSHQSQKTTGTQFF